MTFRFTYRGKTIRIIGAGYWRQGKKIYEQAQTNLPKSTTGKTSRGSRFLASARSAYLKRRGRQSDSSLSKKSVDFFKETANKHHTGYQKMIRNLLDQYAEHFSGRV